MIVRRVPQKRNHHLAQLHRRRANAEPEFGGEPASHRACIVTTSPKVPEKGFVIRGGRELEDHMECEWDLFRSIPSLEIEGASVLDEFSWVNKSDCTAARF